MGFLKGIGKFVKKNVNVKQIVKAVGKYGAMVPGIGGIVGGTIGQLQDAHYAKKEQREADAQTAIDNASTFMGNATGTIAGQFISKTAQNAYNTASTEFKTGVATVGVNVADHTIKLWFKKHWKLLTGVVIGIPVVIFAIKKMFPKKRVYGRR